MAVNKGFGEMLREARVSHGLTYTTVSRRLRLRPDVIQAIEDEDFSRIPPRSYARAMVHAYATLVHLNANAITDKYLDAAYDYENNLPQSYKRQLRTMNSDGRAERNRFEYRNDEPRSLGAAAPAYAAQRNDYPRSRNTRYANDSGPHEPGREHRRERTPGRSSRLEAQRREEAQQQARRSRRLAEQERNEGGAGVAAKAAAATALTGIAGMLPHKKKYDINHSIYADRKPEKLTERFRRTQPRMSQASQSVGFGNNIGTFGGAAAPTHSKLPFIIGAVIILIVLVVVVRGCSGTSTVAASTSTKNTTTNSTVHISGLTDPGDAGTVEKETKVVKIAPTAAVFSYEVPSGSDCYMEIYVDESSTPTLAKTVSGPSRGSYDVTGTLSFVTSNPGGVVIRVDGKTVEPEDKKGNGVYTYTVNFDEILQQWREENDQ